MYQIYVRDYILNRVAQVTDFQSLKLIPRFNAVGSFVLVLPTNTIASKEIIKPKAGIVVVRNGVTLFSGPVTSKKRVWNADGDTLTIGGKDDNEYLRRHTAYPVTDGPFNLKAYDVRTGAAETIMKQYVFDNIGWRPDRSVAIRIEPDKGLGSTITGRGRFQTLLELLQGLAIAGGGLGFRLLHIGNALELQVYQPTDKTKSVLFSPMLGNLASFEYSSEAPEGNHLIIGGGGEGTERILLERGDIQSGLDWGRIESFIDRRDTTDITELQQNLDEEMITRAEKNKLSFVPIDTPSLSFGKDYRLGDKVSVVLTQPGEVINIEILHYFISAYQTMAVDHEKVRIIQEKLDVIQDIVREVVLNITPDGESVTPMVGNAENDGGLGLFSKMRIHNKRLSNLERM